MKDHLIIRSAIDPFKWCSKKTIKIDYKKKENKKQVHLRIENIETLFFL